MDCPMHKITGEKDVNPQRNNPQNKEQAFCFTWHEFLNNLYRLSQVKDQKMRESMFNRELDIFKKLVNSYR